jgi:hypothetical protein
MGSRAEALDAPAATTGDKTMTDRELLEKAAKAAGIEFGADRLDCGLSLSHPSRYLPKWSPLTDDGDALRLAVKLKIDILHDEPQNNDAYVMAGSWDHVEVVDGEGIRLAATRRAIVRAAAALAGD